MEEKLYELYFNEESENEAIAYILIPIEFGDMETLHKVQKQLINDGYVITKVEAPYIQCQKVGD